MSDQDSGTKTEKATPKRLRDAKKKGDIAKSRDLTNTLLLGFMLLFFWFSGQEIASDIMDFTIETLETASFSTNHGLINFGARAADLLISVSVKCFLPLLIAALLIELVQAGAIFTVEKVKPKLSNISFTGGMKRIFSMNSFVELFKSIVKTITIFSICVFIAYHSLDSITNLFWFESTHIATMMKSQSEKLLGATFLLFVLVALADFSYQKYVFEKKMKMSLEEVKREYKNSEGDPQIKGQRQQLSREWAMEGATNSASNATVLIVNPTHIAISLSYNKELAPVPTITATGKDDIALAMREAARQAQVPVLKNIQLARTLHAQTKSGDSVPGELFSVIAEVIVWAESITAKLHGTNANQAGPNQINNGQIKNGQTSKDQAKAEKSPTAPGEDLTAYSGVLHQ